MLSVLSWLGIGDAYSATKAALWQATNTQRVTLAPTGVHVASLHLGYADTPMTKGVNAPKLDPADVVRSAYDGLEAGSWEILADELSGRVKARPRRSRGAALPAAGQEADLSRLGQPAARLRCGAATRPPAPMVVGAVTDRLRPRSLAR